MKKVELNEENIVAEDVLTEESPEDVQIEKKGGKNKLYVGILLGMVFTILIGITAYYFLVVYKNANSIETDGGSLEGDVIPTTAPSGVDTLDSSSKNNSEISSKVVWEKAPIQIEAFPLLDMEKVNAQKYNDVLPEGYSTTFYKMGEFESGEDLIYAKVPVSGMGVWQNLIVIVKDENAYKIVENMSNLSSVRSYILSSYDYVKLPISDLELPEKFVNNSKEYMTGGLTLAENYNRLGSKDYKPVFYEKSSYGDIYLEYYLIDDTQVHTRAAHLKAFDGRISKLDVVPPFIHGDEYNPYVIVDGDEERSGNYSNSTFRGCGGTPGVTVIKDGSTLVSDIEMVGTAEGEELYVLNGQDNSLHDLLYKDYSVGRLEEDLIEFEQFMNNKPYFLWQDAIGDWRVFFSADYQPMAECAKPVIYLYPEEETSVSVEVGADVTLSDPLYPVGGWNVLAHPTGLIEYRNTSYESLFWEGKGHGIYPDIKDYGFLVTQDKLEETIYEHLSLLGLNEKESSDFMLFWKDKLPEDDYVRLTWLGTNEMDELAPLHVSPTPDTSIRVFLDFEGYSYPVNLIPQTLSHPERTGFTLVEWGGLLIDGK